MNTPFTQWDYPDSKMEVGTWLEYCQREVERVNRQGNGRLAEIVSEKNGRLKEGVARIAVGVV